jgi:AcrR family transcriptional regulator
MVPPDRQAASPRLAERPPTRDRTTDAELAIFAATEQLLGEQAAATVKVSSIIERAGVSRATFYHYFSSKLGVLSGLLARVMDDVFSVSVPMLRQAGAASIHDSLRISMRSAVERWAVHRTVLHAVMANFSSDPELEAQWTRLMSRFAVAVADEIDDERRLGRLPAGLESHRLAMALVWSTERCLYVAGRGLEPLIKDELAAVDVLADVWAGALGVSDARGLESTAA